MAEQTIDWWESGPRFSPPDAAARAMRVPPRFTSDFRIGDFVVGALVCAASAAAATWALLETVHIGVHQQHGPGFWWLALALPAAVFAIGVATGMMFLGVERFGRGGVAGPLGLAGLLAGVAVGLAVAAILRTADPDAGLEDPQLLGIAAIVLIVAAVIVGARVPANRHAARRGVERIQRLRETGTRHTGVVMALPDARAWKSRGYGPVPVRYETSDGIRRIDVTMTALSFRIPKPGTHVLVFRDAASGDVHVELDPAFIPTFDENTHRYESQADGGS